MGMEVPAELAPLNRIRVETALSRFPIHRLSKKGSITIDFTSDAEFQWKVAYTKEHGEPGPLAYKVDTLIVNRRIDEAPRPLPEIIRLGTLREINRELGLAEDDTQNVRRALLQNASAFISAKIRFKRKNTRDSREKWREVHYSRYSLVFTGDVLPDGQTADAVYIVLNPPHRKLLDDAEARPLDYDYLTSLTPGSQRLYELLSFQVYGALTNGRSRAKLIYSEYCLCAPQVRYDTFDAVKKQMFKICKPHRESGYILKAEYQQIQDGQGRPDWEMFYTPGPKALIEFEAFNRRGPRSALVIGPTQATAPSPVASSQPAMLSSNADTLALTELTRRGITDRKARELLATLKPGQNLLDQLAYVDHVIAAAPTGKFHNPSGFYVSFIEQNAPIPAAFPVPSRLHAQQEVRQAKKSERVRLDQLRSEYDDYCTAEVWRYINEVLPANEYQQLFETERLQISRMLRNTPADELDALAHAGIRAEFRKNSRIALPSFEGFCRQQPQTTVIDPA